MSPLHAFILGVVEGLTEFLPVSSTGHLLMAGRLLGLTQTSFLKTFEIAIQLGAIAAVAWVERRALWRDIPAVKKAAVAFIPTGIIGFVLYKVIKQYLLASDAVVPWALLVGGVLIIVAEMWLAKRAAPATIDVKVLASPEADLSAITYGKALAIGTIQSLSVVPGVSRSAASIVGAMFLGIDRAAAVRFSFLLAIPTMAAATGYDLLKNADGFSGSDTVALAIGTVTAFVIALVTLRFLLRYVRTKSLAPFGWYRIVAALAYWALLRAV